MQKKSQRGGNKMIVNKEIAKRKCCFYASDFHLEMTIVPYINKRIEENKNIIIITENNLEESIKILVSHINIKNKDKILNLDWNNCEIPQTILKKNSIIILNGSKKFIESKNEKIKNKISEEVEEIIDCYLFDEIKEEIVTIRDKYEQVVNNLQKF